MKKLLELEQKLRKAKEELEKQSMLGSMNPIDGNSTGMPPGTSGGSVNKDEHEDKDKDKKMIESKMDEHNEDKHDEPKDEDSAKKTDIPKSITDQSAGDIISDQDKGPLEKNELIKFHSNGQWSLNKATIDAKPNGEFDVPVKEVYDGDDDFVHVGNRGVDGDDKGKTDKLADKEKQLLKD